MLIVKTTLFCLLLHFSQSSLQIEEPFVTTVHNARNTTAFFTEAQSGLPILVCLDCVIDRIEKLKKLPIYPNVTSIELDATSIRTIDKKSFEIFSNLREVSLKNNSLTEVNELTGRASGLDRLWLDGNKIVNLNAVCANNPRELHMTHNQIKSLAELKCKSYVEVLDLSFNEVQDITLKQSSLSLVSLKVLRLSHNKLTHFKVAENVFPSLEELYMDHNQISSNVAFNYAPNLRVLSLRSNALDYLYWHNLKGEHLEVVDLSRNYIRNFEIGTFNSNIVDLDVSYNRINVIVPEMFMGLARLQMFNVSNNFIRNLNGSEFLGSRFLVHLDLSYNHFMAIDPRPLNHLWELTTVDLRGNVLNCKTLDNLSREDSKKYLFDSIPCHEENGGNVGSIIGNSTDKMNSIFWTHMRLLMAKLGSWQRPTVRVAEVVLKNVTIQ